MNAVDPRARIGAANNADLYAAILGAQGLRHARDAAVFACLDDPPPYYSILTTLDPGAVPAQEAWLARLRAEGRSGAVKDGFARLDAARLGLRTLFEAQWIWREGSGPMPEGWSAVSSAEALSLWHDAWRSGSPTDRTVFPPACLGDPALTFLWRREGPRVIAGCLLNRSEGAMGLSNVFGEGAPGEVFAEATAAAGAVAGGRPLVGYEGGEWLTAAAEAGFDAVGPLRVLVEPAGAPPS